MNTLRTMLIALATLAATATYAQDDIQGPGPGDAPGAAKDIGGIDFVWCPPGEYAKGSNIPPEEIAKQYGGLPEWYADEHPQETATIADGFWISRTEITHAQWAATANSRPWGEQAPQGDDLPAVGMTWEEAANFAREFGQSHAVAARLPLEAEWEYACRAGSPHEYCFGNDESRLGEYAWYWDNSDRELHPVGGKLPNAWGLYDMHGNVWEWCGDSMRTYSKLRVVDPVGNAAIESRAVRGGSWSNDLARGVRCAFRNQYSPRRSDNYLGFRLVRDQDRS